MTDRAGDGLTRTELVCVALMAAIMGSFARGYHPTNPPGTLVLRLFFGAVVLWSLVRLVRPGPVGGWPRRLLIGAAVLSGIPVMGMTVGTSWLVLQMRLPELAIPIIVAQLILLSLLCVWAWRVPTVRRLVMRTVGLGSS